MNWKKSAVAAYGVLMVFIAVQSRTAAILASILTASLSGPILKYYFGYEKIQDWWYSLCAASAGLLFSVVFLRNMAEAGLFLGAATAQFIAFVFVSRFRQRGSFFWHAMASLFSNGAWYLTIHVFKELDSYTLLIVPYLAGIITGRTIGVLWAQYIEQKFHLVADVTRDAKLAPGKRLQYIVREKMFWMIGGALILYIVAGSLFFSGDTLHDLYVVVVLGIGQNFLYTLDSRASQRGNKTYIILAGIPAGAVFYVFATYLFSKGVPLVLLAPYMLSTALGSTTGAIFSMVMEWTHRIMPDAHVNDPHAYKRIQQSIVPRIIIIGLVVLWAFYSETVLHILGYVATTLVLPFPVVAHMQIPRVFVILSVAVLFFLSQSLHTVMSGAGNRDNVKYHVFSSVLYGLFGFFVLKYIAQNASLPDILPVAVLAGCLGKVYGRTVSEFIEIKLAARMDVNLKSI